jgi:signal peptidase II
MEVGLKDSVKKYGLLFLIAGLLIALDQWTKYLVRTNIPFGESWMPWTWLAPYARIVHWNNTGVAFGMFQGYGYIFMVLAVLVAGAIIYYYPRIPANEWLMRVALGMQLGGALGNLIDRIFYNFHVTDFISVGNFAVFNVADASISCGVVLLLLVVWIREGQEKKSAAPPIEVSPLDSGKESGDNH